MRARLRLTLLLLLTACSSAEKTLGPTSYHVEGVWRFDQYVENNDLEVYCTGSGDLTVTQDGPRFTAQGTHSGYCADPSGSVGFTDEPLTISDGSIDNTTITFHSDDCAYTGTARGVRPDSVTGTATCRTRFGSSTVTLTGPWRLKPPPDLVPPTVTASTFGGGSNGTLEAGDDTLYVHIVAQDNTALRTVGYELRDPSRGVTVRRDSLLVAADTVAALDDTLIFPLPFGLPLPIPYGTPFQGSVFARDTAGNPAFATLEPITIRDPDPPVATGSVTGSILPDSTAALRDTLAITVTVASPRSLTYVGYRLTNFGGLGDSVAVSDTAATHAFRVPVPFEWKGLELTVEVFGRDRFGLEDHEQVTQLRVAVFPSLPTQTFRVGQGVSELVYDEPRGRLYLMTALDSTPQAGQPEVRVFQFSPAGFLPGIPVSWFASGMELSPSGDSLLLTSYNGRLGIIDLTTLAQDSTEPITFTPSNGRFPYKVRAMANGKAMISIRSADWGAGDPGQLVEFDLGTGTQTLRTDVGDSGAVGRTPLLGRTPDRSRLLLWSSQATVNAAQLYVSAMDSFGPSVPMPVPPVGATSVSSDAAGTLWLVGNVLLDGTLTPLRQLESGIYAGTSVLSYDGAYAYVSVPEGVAKVRTSDGARVELILLQDPPYLLTITPNGNTLIAVGFGLQIVDLR